MKWALRLQAVLIAAVTTTSTNAANIHLGATPPGDAAQWLLVSLARGDGPPLSFGVKSDGGNRFIAVPPATPFWLLRTDGGFAMHDNLHDLAETHHAIDAGLAALEITVGELATEGGQLVQHFTYAPGGPVSLPVEGFLPEPGALVVAISALTSFLARRGARRG